MAYKNPLREQMINYLNARVAPFPDYIQWYILDCLPKYIFRYDKTKHSECFCPECDSTFMKDDAIGGKDAFCPVCGFKGKYRYLGYRTNLHDSVNIAIPEILETGERSITIYKAYRNYTRINNENRRAFSTTHYGVFMYDFANITFDNNGNRHIYKIYSGGYYYKDWHPLYYGTIKDNCYVHPSIQNIFPEYSQLAGNYLNIDSYICGLDYNIYRPNINKSVTYYNVSSNMKGSLRKSKISYQGYRLCQKHKIDESDDVITKFSSLINRHDYFNPEIFNYMSFKKMVNYFSTQVKLIPNSSWYVNDKFSKLVNEYIDYIQYKQHSGCDINLKAIRFPSNLIREHNKIVNERNAEILRRRRLNEKKKIAENKKKAKSIKSIVEAIWKKEGSLYSDGTYTVFFPKTSDEFKYEGNILNHCVGSMPKYYENNINNEALKKVFFIRKIKEPNKPFFTLEANIYDNQIIQLYGFCDSSAPDEIRNFATKFLDYYISTTIIAEKSTNLANVG